MGAWGTSIYSCDIAEDVKDACNVIFAFYDIEEGNRRLFSAFSDIVNQSFIDNEYASFWYALSDWQWKHGMLSTSIKERTLNLLENHSGIEEWDKADVPKRIKVLDQLKKQLLQPQSKFTKPRVRVCKPKHMPGDLIVFKASTYIDNDICNKWKKRSFCPPLFYESPAFYNSPYEDVDGYDACGKFMALLCVGTVRESYCEYTDEVFNEHSVYVWYDYLSPKEPSTDDLSTCGFLPYIDWQWKDYNRNITKSVEWGYEFTLISEKFKQCREIDFMCTQNKHSEVERYRHLLSQKKYFSNYYGGFTIADMFSTMFEEKNRATLIGEEYDNLLNSKIQAPRLLLPEEVDANFQKFIESLQSHSPL